MERQSVLVTFGVAVYNVSSYLPQCLDSLMSQAGDDTEFLLIDDGSTDGSSEICDRYEQKDPRFRVIHQANRGVCAVRNTIITQAMGTWISFVDGDDRVLPDTLERFRSVEKTTFDILYFSRLFFRSDHAIPSAKPSDRWQALRIPEELGVLALETMYSAGQDASYDFVALRPVYAKLFRTAFLRECGLRFCEVLTMGEDVEFNLRCIAAAHSIMLCASPVYLYRNNQTSAVRRYREDIVKDNTALVKKLSEVSGLFPSLRQEMEQRFYMRCIADLGTCLLSGCCHEDNPKPLLERKDEFLNLLSLPWSRTAMERVPFERLSKREQRLLLLLRKKDFRAVCRHFSGRFRQEALKRQLAESFVANWLYHMYEAVKHALR